MTSLKDVNPRVSAIRVSSQNNLHHLAQKIVRGIQQKVKKPFREVIDVSLGDLHRSGLKPLSFVRQVLAVCLYPELLTDKRLPLDVRQRAQRLLEACDGESVGSYTASSGLLYVRERIAEFISRRDDGIPANAKNIFISSGAQRALMVLMKNDCGVVHLHVLAYDSDWVAQVIVKLLSHGDGGTESGVLTPLPCPHTLPALLDEAGVVMVPYRLTEDKGWAVEMKELQRALMTSRGRCDPRAIYISNPGNPTGHLQDKASMQEVIQFAAAQRLLLLVDEVYQDSVYGQNREFVSYKKVLSEMDKDVRETLEMVSFHSLSCACVAECGLRAGYMEVLNMDPEVMHFVDTLLCTDISAPVTGQLALDLMLHPPKPGEPSFDTHAQEILLTRAILSQNVQRALKVLNDLPLIKCQPAMGGIYLYPRLDLPAVITEQAKMMGIEAGVFYCQRLLEEEGLLVGAEEDSSDGINHLRLCVLVSPDLLEEALSRLTSFQLRLLTGKLKVQET